MPRAALAASAQACAIALEALRLLLRKPGLSSQASQYFLTLAPNPYSRPDREPESEPGSNRLWGREAGRMNL